MQYYDPGAASTETPQEAAENAAPPFNLDLEQAVLGALLVWNDVLDDITFLESSHFFDQLHGAIYEAICRRLKAGRSVTPLDLCKEFEDATPIDGAITVPHYIRGLGVKACTRRQVADYARTIVDLADRGILILIGEDLADAARQATLDTPPRVLIEETEQRLYSVAEYSARGEAQVVTFADASTRAIEEVSKAYQNQSSGLSTGIPALDRKLGGGLQPTDLTVAAGRPSMGKTALATNIAFNVAHQVQIPVGFFSLEMSASQLAMRILSERVQIPSNKLRRGDIEGRDFKQLMAEAESLNKLPIFTDQLGGITIAQLTARARRMKRKHNIGLIVVDYLQLMQPSKRRENRVQDITEITIGLKTLAKELEVPVLALSQLSREVEKRESKRPQLSDLRESGSIEQDADVVLFVYRDEYYLERAAPAEDDAARYLEWQGKLAAAAGKAEIIIGKQRHGPLGVVPVAFDGSLTRFSSLAEAR
jgi:replicative DNA helicase